MLCKYDEKGDDKMMLIMCKYDENDKMMLCKYEN